MNRRWRNLTTRRTRRFDPPWVVSAPAVPVLAPGFRDQAGSRPRWVASRRGRFTQVPPLPVVVASRPPGFLEPAMRLRMGPPRRGRYFTVPCARPSRAHGFTEPAGPRQRLGLPRRGEFFTVPFQQPVVSTPPVPDWRGRHHRPTGSGRRGEFLPIPLQGLAPTAPVAVPSFLTARRRPAAPLRHPGEFFPVLPQPVVTPTPVIPALLRQARRSQLPVRRGEFSQPTWPQIAPTVPAVPPQRTRAFTGSRRALAIRRGRFLLVPGVGAVAGPGPVAPKMLRQNVRRLVSPRHGRVFTLPLVGAVPAPSNFLCQDFTTTTTTVALSATQTTVAYSATTTTVRYSASSTQDTYSGTSNICGR